MGYPKMQTIPFRRLLRYSEAVDVLKLSSYTPAEAMTVFNYTTAHEMNLNLKHYKVLAHYHSKYPLKLWAASYDITGLQLFGCIKN
jgi:hypothetical protein